MEKNKKILIVEDDASVAKRIKRILLKLGYSVVTLGWDSQEIFSNAAKEKPDLILMDIEIRNKLARAETAKKIREDLDVPIISVAGHPENELIKVARKKELFGYLLKPVNKKDLEISVKIAFFRHAIEKRLKERMRKALREREELYKQLVDNINEGIVIQNKRGIVSSANEKFLRMIGYNRNKVIGRPITELLGEGWLRKNSGHGLRQKGDRSKSVELAWKRKDGKRIFTILSPKPIYGEKGRFLGSVSVLTDITDRREVEMELRRSHERLRSLSHHLQSVREKESKRIASEIHDELGQYLTALKIDLSWLSNRVSFEKGGRELFEKIASMTALVDRTIQTVQKISAELRPGLLDDLGLVPAIEWLAQDFQNRTKIKCRTRLWCNDIELDPDSSTAIFRISQEALTNVTRHAKASRVEISLKKEKGVLILKISDNGRGIKEDDVFSPSSLGLMGMRERILPFGGELSITGAPKKGTTLTVSLPCRKMLKND